MKVFEFHIPVIGFGDTSSEAFNHAMGFLLSQPNEALKHREVDYEEVHGEADFARELSRIMSTAHDEDARGFFLTEAPEPDN
tara:strand:- start:495 stop:740 length:246 start_codon:yes stop_codon:yes gene_type:complete